MASHRVAGAPLDFAALRIELEVPGDFSLAAQAEAEADDAGRVVQLRDADAIADVASFIRPGSALEAEPQRLASPSEQSDLFQHGLTRSWPPCRRSCRRRTSWHIVLIAPSST
jgi:hypothetical protein